MVKDEEEKALQKKYAEEALDRKAKQQSNPIFTIVLLECLRIL